VVWAPGEPGGDLPPLYMRHRGGAIVHRDSATTTTHEDDACGAWHLLAGVGPATLQVEAPGSARLRRDSLRRLGVHTPPYPAEGEKGLPSREDAARITSALHAHLSRLPRDAAARQFAAWLPLRPLFEHWEAVERSMAEQQQAVAAA
jgi:hypothetical protein